MTATPKRDEERFLVRKRLENVFDNFRHEVEKTRSRACSSPFEWNFGDSHVTERVISQLLTELDGLELLRNVVVIAATNRLTS